jgi:hypothetical protein
MKCLITLINYHIISIHDTKTKEKKNYAHTKSKTQVRCLKLMIILKRLPHVCFTNLANDVICSCKCLKIQRRGILRQVMTKL